MIQKAKRIAVENGNQISISPIEPIAKVSDLTPESILDSCARVLNGQPGDVVTRITKDEILIQISVG